MHVFMYLYVCVCVPVENVSDYYLQLVRLKFILKYILYPLLYFTFCNININGFQNFIINTL